MHDDDEDPESEELSLPEVVVGGRKGSKAATGPPAWKLSQNNGKEEEESTEGSELDDFVPEEDQHAYSVVDLGDLAVAYDVRSSVNNDDGGGNKGKRVKEQLFDNRGDGVSEASRYNGVGQHRLQ